MKTFTKSPSASATVATLVLYLVVSVWTIDPEYRILAQQNFLPEAGFSDDAVRTSVTSDPENNLTYGSNKTSKILAGPSRPRPPPPYIPPSGNAPYGDLQSQGSGTPQATQNHPSISPIDMQLLNAMEKLVARMDALENRVKTLESIVHFLTGKEKPSSQLGGMQRGSCPEKFLQIDGIRGKCFHISSLEKAGTVTDWKMGATECAKLGGRLAEMLTYSDYHRIASYLAKYGNIRNSATTDYWTGGLNPGLIWIWSESGTQVDLDKRFWNENDNSSNSPGCLKLSYSIRLNTFYFKGAPCSQAQNFLCEVLDNSVARALASFEQNLTRQGLEELDDSNEQFSENKS